MFQALVLFKSVVLAPVLEKKIMKNCLQGTRNPWKLGTLHGRWPGCHCCHIIYVHGDTVWAYDVAEELDLGDVELAFLCFDVEVIGKETLP